MYTTKTPVVANRTTARKMADVFYGTARPAKPVQTTTKRTRQAPSFDMLMGRQASQPAETDIVDIAVGSDSDRPYSAQAH